MAELVRPKKKKSQQVRKSQDKKQERCKGLREEVHYGPVDGERGAASSSLFEDVESVCVQASGAFSDIPLTANTERPVPELEDTAHAAEPPHSSALEPYGDHVKQCMCGEDKEHTKDARGDNLSTNHEETLLTSAKLADGGDIVKNGNFWTLENCNIPLLETSVEPQFMSRKQESKTGPLCGVELRAPAVLPITENQLSPTGLPLAEESCPPGLAPAELLEPKAEKVQQRLYPELPKAPPAVQPFTREQLRLWEPGSWLHNVELHAAEFECGAHQEGHELHELLLHYSRCRKQLIQAQAELRAANSDCKSSQNRLWSFRDEQLTLQGVCADQAKVSRYHRFQQVVLNRAVLSELQRQFEMKAELLHQTVALHTYTAVLSRLQIESYLYQLLAKNPVTRNIAVAEPASDWSESKVQLSSLQSLKESISVLFSFTRRAFEDTQFQEDIHMWLRKLVSVLHRVGSVGDHLFLLNHLLCCPAGVGKWAVQFLQVKVLDNPSGVYHFMQALAILMSPVRNRANFLCHMKPCERKSTSGPGSGNWTLVDEGGEEDEDPETSWLLLTEDDLITFFCQFPFDELFKHLLGMSLQGAYQPEETTSQKMIKIFAFASSVVELLAVGLQTYNRARYRQFVKRIGHMIRMTLCYVSDHWAQYISVMQAGTSTAQEQTFPVEKLQVEFDHLFLRAVLHVLRAKRLGIWLFMSEMPYGTLSSAMLWKIYYIMQCTETEDLDRLSLSPSLNNCVESVRDCEHREKFVCCLSEMNSSDAICLLTTFAHMAQPKRHDEDAEFVCAVVLQIYEVSYVNVATRETFSKVGRELLAAIATAHPHIISVLLRRVQETIDKVGMVSLYLFKELPLHLWRPVFSEISVIRSWLLDYSLPTVENKLACIILESLNWGFLQDGCLALDPQLHTEVSLLVAESYQKYLTDKPYGGIISEGIKQVSYLANVVRLGNTPEASFSQWAWDMVLRLKLHVNERFPQETWSPKPSTSTVVPDLSDSPTMHPVLKAVKAGLPIGCFLALAMTTIGHSLEKFCSEGIDLLHTLVQYRHLRAVVQILDNLLPLTYPCQFYLLNNEQFLKCIQLFLQLDSGAPQGVAQQVTHKVSQHLIKFSSGENVKLLNSVIQAHLLESSKNSQVGPAAVLEFWVQVMTTQDFWYRDKSVLYIMDHLCQAAVLYKQEECVQKLLYQQHKNALGHHGDRGLLSSFVGWFVAGNVTPSFIEGNALPREVWFSWLVLSMESLFEEDSQLRPCMEHEMLSNTGLSPEQALKKAQQRLKLHVAPSLQRMMIYRWAHQALATPADHPLLPLVWQKFLQLYLRQPGPEFGMEAKGCIGKRYFQSSTHAGLLKELKQRLVEVSDFHHAASKAIKVPSSTCETGHASPHPSTQYMTSPELHVELVRLFSVFAVWLEDENLQRQEVYLPSLPKQYDPYRLAKIMQSDQGVWMEYLDIERVQHELTKVLSIWVKVRAEPLYVKNTSSIFTDIMNPEAARERILINLRKHDTPQPTLDLVPMSAPIPDISPNCLSDETLSSKLLQEDLSKLQQQAKLAVLRETQQVALDSELLETLPQLYINREEQLSVQLECQGSGGQPCQGPAHVTVKFEGMYKVEPVQNQIQALKRDIRQLQTDAIQPPAQSVAEAAVHVETFITALVNNFKVLPSPVAQKVGISAFYQVVSFVCEDTQRHPPTRQFFSSCIEILGQVFIRDSHQECRRMLKTILLNGHLCTLLSPYFTPNASPGGLVDMYEEVVSSLGTDSGDVIFMLLTKFDVLQWLASAQPSFSERSRMVELVHLGLSVCGLEPDSELLMPFNLLCKHWTQLLCYQFPDHYSDCLRLLMQSSSEQLLSPECWRASLQVLGCSPQSMKNAPKAPGCTRDPDPVSLSHQHVAETIEWLSNFFLKLRLSKEDFRSFGLYSKWGPYIEYVQVLLQYLVEYAVDVELNTCAKEPVGSEKVLKAVLDLHSKTAALFKPWILLLNTSDESNARCYPWLETDTAAAARLVKLYSECTNTIRSKFKGRMLAEHRGALWLHLMHYCDTCTTPKMPEYLLYTYHSAYSHLPWSDLHPDPALMNRFFNVERGSPKSCFLFIGELLCQVNWFSVLKGALGPQPSSADQTMVTYLFYMMVFLAKDENLLSKPESPLLSLLSQSSSLPWHFVDLSSYHNVVGYVSTRYSPTLVLRQNSSSQLIIDLLQTSAGFGPSAQGIRHMGVTPKCQSFIRLMVTFLTSLDQSGDVSLSSLECELEKLLECIVLFSPPETDVQQRHRAVSSLFAELLVLLNTTSVSTAEGLEARLHSWVQKEAHAHLALPLLTAACCGLASVRHMARTTEACISAYFSHGCCVDQYCGWGPVLASLQVPELTVDDFIKESLSMSSLLTLYVYVLQKLNLEQTLANEKRTLTLLNTWISQVFPSGPQDEAKLFLWWHKSLQLAVLQVEQGEEGGLGLLLSGLQNRIAQLGEDRLSSGILGAIGLGRKSPLTSRFRVVARGISAFLLAQMPSESQVRLQPEADLTLSTRTQQALAALDSMASSKQYSEFQEALAQTCRFIRYPGHCLHDWSRLLALLINALYADVRYLDILR
ncbi:ectopic P granules protein 5 homolog isoform X3 [Scleropages formosus]|uniref:Ectopic P-granules autophagy protein 5 homolog (C. elegans) n=1 Tax=Scleropages formosus TaxID=113540 RepID=A0A8C9UZ18_SCLFO|nr:ectopic P granules protein 5 homolog isoform X3 [Scleropages formosus]